MKLISALAKKLYPNKGYTRLKQRTIEAMACPQCVEGAPVIRGDYTKGEV